MTDSSEFAESEPDDNRQMQTVALEIRVADEKVTFQINLPSGPATWESLLPFMRTLIKVASDISQEYFTQKGHPVSCRAGCGICCRQLVPLGEFEAHRLRRLVDSMPEPRRTEIRKRFQAVEERVRAAGMAVSFDKSNPLSVEEMTRRAVDHFKLMIPCPFLEDESCSIYEERPLKCREYLVTSPSENCEDPSSPTVVTLPIPLNVFMTTLVLDKEQRGSEVRWVPLSQLISWTDTHAPEAPTKTGPQLLHEFMTYLTQSKPSRRLGQA